MTREIGDFLCPGYSGEGDGASPDLLRATFDGGALRSFSVADATNGAPKVGESVGGWTLMAMFERNGEPVAAFEQLSRQDGAIAFVTAAGLLRACAKTLEPTTEGEAALKRHGIASWYRGHDKAEVLPDRKDVMRGELLAAGRDPDWAEVAACYPPVRDAFFEGHRRPHTFVGTGISADVIPLYYQDVTMVSRVPIGVVAPGSEAAMAAGELWEGLLGGWAPIVRTVYPLAPDESWEVVTLASSATANAFQQPVWYRLIHMKAGRPLETKYVDSFLPFPKAGERLRERFYEELLQTLEYWDDAIGGGMEVVGWDEFSLRSRDAFAREIITRRGDHPKYGVVDQAYAGAEHDGFQDVLVSSALACVEWGYFERARAYLDNYFTHFVRADGTLRYRGPEMGKYGVMLTCLGLHFDYARDATLLRKHRAKIDAVADILLDRWKAARRRDPDDPAYGMIDGYHEADINFLTPNVYECDYDRPYLSNTGEAWRGLRDLAGAYSAVAETDGDAALKQRANALREAAEAMFGDARRGVEKTWVVKDGVAGLPIIAGDKTFYWEHPYRARPELYDENRVWSELYFGGAATEETTRRIWDIAGERGHTTLGVFNNRKSLVGFLVWEEIAGLLQHDMTAEALLVFYAQAAHAHTRGTWTAIECVDMDRARGAHSPYCLPAQMTVPIALKWLLVHEDPISGAITLARGVPRERLAHGRTIGVKDAPTRRGKISYRIDSRIDEGEILASVTLPDRPGAPIRLRLRAPKPFVLAGAKLRGAQETPLPIDGDCVVLPEGMVGEIAIATRWTAADNGG